MGARAFGEEVDRMILERSPRYSKKPMDKDWIEFTVNHPYQSDSYRNDQYEGRYLNVSRTGMRFLSRRPTNVRLGDQMILQFTPPGMFKAIVAQAQVVRKTGRFDYAVCFTHISEKDQRLFDVAIEKCFKTSPVNLIHEAMDRSKGFLEGSWELLCLLGTMTALIASILYATT